MVAFSPAFTHTSVDLRKIYDSQNMYKAWNFSFTCLSSRVISSKLEPSCDAGKSIKDGFLRDIAFQKVFNGNNNENNNGTQVSQKKSVFYLILSFKMAF